MHHHNTRQSSLGLFSLPFGATDYSVKFVSYQFVKFWNSLSLELRNTKNKQTFNKNLKIISKEFIGLQIAFYDQHFNCTPLFFLSLFLFI